MEKIIHKLQAICLILFVPFGIIGGATIAENLFDNGKVLLIGLFLVVVSAIMFAFLLVSDSIERR